MNGTSVDAQTRVFVALGSNLGERQRHISQACVEISALPDVRELRCSSVFETDPMGPQNQPDYLNAVCQFYYGESPRMLLNELQSIEKAHGRVKKKSRWTARPLDLDILLFGDEQIDEPDLQIPHIGIAERSFVIWPLLELQPGLSIPGLGPAVEFKKQCQAFGIQKYKGFS
ncbi:MAG: 2-amino-4-hydroxy-6-hydroxymethyldihydropteridine diphosphokinase [Granulosicoccus sp.]